MAGNKARESYTVFEYLYRDAGNYKAFGEILLLGDHTESDTSTIVDACESGNRFVAEQVGVPALYDELYAFSGGPTADDHVFHEFWKLRNALPEEVTRAPWGSVYDLKSRFLRASRQWKYELSPHWDTGWR